MDRIHASRAARRQDCPGGNRVARRAGRLGTVVIAGAMLAAGTSLAPQSASALDEDGGADFMTTMEPVFDGWRSTVDLTVLRPLGIGRIVVGSVLLIPSTLFNAIALPLGQDTSVFAEDLDRFVIEPVEYTFQRPIGEDLVGG